MEANKAVLLVGVLPELVDFSAFPGLTAEKVHAGIKAQMAKLTELGYQPQHILVDLGETAAQVVAKKLGEQPFACVMLGAGTRTPPAHLQLFEKLINAVHAGAPQAKICFNSSPADSVDAIQRWI